MQQPDSNKANAIMVAASSTQVDVGRNAGGTHAGRTPGIYTHGTLAVLAVSDTYKQVCSNSLRFKAAFNNLCLIVYKQGELIIYKARFNM
jgi:hypothetical protein